LKLLELLVQTAVYEGHHWALRPAGTERLKFVKY